MNYSDKLIYEASIPFRYIVHGINHSYTRYMLALMKRATCSICRHGSVECVVLLICFVASLQFSATNNGW
jgi:hypothetical protein